MNSPTPKWKDKAKELNAEADQQADSLLGDLKESKWTGVILWGSVAAAVIGIVVLLLD